MSTPVHRIYVALPVVGGIRASARDAIISELQARFPSFTIIEGAGYHEGKTEATLVITIATEDAAAVVRAAKILCHKAQQSSVGLECAGQYSRLFNPQVFGVYSAEDKEALANGDFNEQELGDPVGPPLTATEILERREGGAATPQDWFQIGFVNPILQELAERILPFEFWNEKDHGKVGSESTPSSPEPSAVQKAFLANCAPVARLWPGEHKTWTEIDWDKPLTCDDPLVRAINPIRYNEALPYPVLCELVFTDGHKVTASFTAEGRYHKAAEGCHQWTLRNKADV